MGPKTTGEPFKGGGHGLIVVPKTHGKAKANALQAAMQTLARRHQLDVFPADPVTGLEYAGCLKMAAFCYMKASRAKALHLMMASFPLTVLG